MDASLNIDAKPAEVRADPRQASSELDELVHIGTFAADAFRLAAHEMRLAVAGAATALLLIIAAALGALVVAGLLIVATVFALHALGLAWPLAFLATAILLGLLCYLAARRAGSLARRLTLPVTRSAMQPED